MDANSHLHLECASLTFLFTLFSDISPLLLRSGYDVVPYPLTDQLGEVAVPVSEDDSKMSTMVKDDEGFDKNNFSFLYFKSN